MTTSNDPKLRGRAALAAALLAPFIALAAACDPCGGGCCSSPADLMIHAEEPLDLSDLVEDAGAEAPALVVDITNVETGESILGGEASFREVDGEPGVFELVTTDRDNVSLGGGELVVEKPGEGSGRAPGCDFASTVTLTLRVPDAWELEEGSLEPETFELEATASTELPVTVWGRWSIELWWVGWMV